MDLSKLPKLSQTSQHQPPPVPQTTATAPPPVVSGVPTGAEAFLDAIIGFIVIIMSWQIFDYLIHLMTGRPFGYPVTDSAGNPLPYPTTAFFWMNLGTAAFGVALLLSAPLALVRSRGSTVGQIVVMGIAAILGGLGVLKSWPILGPQILPILCAGCACYMAWVYIARLRMRA
jgi:hypothetical protein